MRRAYWGLVCLLPTNIISGIGKSVELNNYVAMMGDMMMGMMVMMVKMMVMVVKMMVMVKEEGERKKPLGEEPAPC